nr:hypothetical protein [Mesorhizobium sp. L2C054A000]
MTRHVTFMTIDDAEHYSPDERAAIVAAFPTSSSRSSCGGSARPATSDALEMLEEASDNAYLRSNPMEV